MELREQGDDIRHAPIAPPPNCCQEDTADVSCSVGAENELGEAAIELHQLAAFENLG